MSYNGRPPKENRPVEPLLPPVGAALWVAAAEVGGLGVVRAGGVSGALDERSRCRLKASAFFLI